MPYRIRGFSVACVIGLMCLVLPASVTEAQNLLPGFEITAGVQYGMQDPERPCDSRMDRVERFRRWKAVDRDRGDVAPGILR